VRLEKREKLKHEIVYATIKDAIISYEIKPGAMLPERELSSKLGVSRTPIREALHRLNMEGLVDCIPEKGAFVAKQSLVHYIEISEVREALEGFAVRLCTTRKNEDIVSQLDNKYRDIVKYLECGDFRKAVKCDIEFHQIIFQGANNKKLESFLLNIYDQIKWFAATTVDDPERIKASLKQHQEILQAIINHDGDSAENLMRQHIQDVRKYHVSKHYRFR
jgi:DNA-binding GntR family transcriptional regulator